MRERTRAQQVNPAEVNPEMVTLGRQARGLTQAQLASRMGVHQATVSKLEAGVSRLTADEFQKLAVALDYPMHFFTRRRRIMGSGITELYHRKRQKVGARLLHQVHARAAIRIMNIEDLMRSFDDVTDDVPILPVEHFDDSPEKIARIVRAQWHLPDGPIFSVTKVVEQAGGVVMEFDFETRHIDGFSRRDMSAAPMFFMNRALPPDRWRWTLAHELGHTVMHTDPNEAMEEQADRFASEFLAPASEIKAQLWDLSFAKLAGLKRYWKISMQALLLRARHLNIISDRKLRHMFMQLSKAGYRLREPSELDPPGEPPELLVDVMEDHVARLGYTEQDLCDALALAPADLHAIASPRTPYLRVVR
jgi:Zn-dependent peptidase ImmA (M78 family)/transcriptional regulator with XRE-family HTH domain